MLTDHAWARLSMALPDRALHALGRLNASVYRATGGRVGGRFAHEPVLVITTTGRRTGKPRTTTLLYGRYGDRLVVIASNRGGDRPPAWALNLLAHPQADVQIGKRRVHVDARPADGDERVALWAAMNHAYHGFDEYAAHTTRDIPVFVLTPRDHHRRSPTTPGRMGRDHACGDAGAWR